MMRELTGAEIDQMLRSEIFGRLGCHARGRTYVVPMTYVYDGACLTCQTGDGLKIRMMRENPEVCFEIDRVDRSGGWTSVIAHGHFEELAGDDAAVGLSRLLDHLQAVERSAGILVPHGEGRVVPWREESSPRSDVVFRIRLTAATGRCAGSAETAGMSVAV